jgi:hypothetical protein
VKSELLARESLKELAMSAEKFEGQVTIIAGMDNMNPSA